MFYISSDMFQLFTRQMETVKLVEHIQGQGRKSKLPYDIKHVS